MLHVIDTEFLSCYYLSHIDYVIYTRCLYVLVKKIHFAWISHSLTAVLCSQSLSEKTLHKNDFKKCLLWLHIANRIITFSFAEIIAAVFGHEIF